MNSNMMFMYDQSVSFKLVKAPPKLKAVEVLVKAEKPVDAPTVAPTSTTKEVVKGLFGVLRDWHTNPSIVGVYPTYRDNQGRYLFYSVWDGYHWLYDEDTPESAQGGHQNRISRTQMRYWGDLVLEGKNPIVTPKVLEKNVWHEHKPGLLALDSDLRIKIKRNGKEIKEYRSNKYWNAMYPKSLNHTNSNELNITHFMIVD